MNLIVDASVAVKWLANEIDSDKAHALYDSEDDLAAPSLILAEVGSALWKKCRLKYVTAEQVRLAVEGFPRYLPRLHDIVELTPAAVDLALTLDQSVYDCFYLALARRENAALVTADERMIAAARKAKIKVRRL